MAVTGLHTVHHFAAVAGAAAADGGSGQQLTVTPPAVVAVQQYSTTGQTTQMSWRGRLSDPSSPAKWIGLQRFHHDLWGRQMTDQQAAAAQQRAQQLFKVELMKLMPPSVEISPGCIGRTGEPYSISAAAAATAEAAEACKTATSNSHPSNSSSSSSCQPIVLMVGIVSSCADIVEGLLSDLLLLMHQAGNGATCTCSSSGSAGSDSSGGGGSGGRDGAACVGETQGLPLLGGLEVVLLENGGSSSETDQSESSSSGRSEDPSSALYSAPPAA
jgi:hypothetical protein